MMPKATLCPECSYRWTLVPAVSRSWQCPKCQTARTEQTRQNRCTCGHTYKVHDTIRESGNSWAAFTLPGKDATLEAIEAMPDRAAVLEPPIGSCTQCNCSGYQYRAVN